MLAPLPTHGYRAHDRFVVRVPLWNRTRFAELTTFRALREAIPQLLADQRIVTALSSASPSLVDRLRRIQESGGAADDERRELAALRSLRKYLLRMTHRPTPFGLLAGVGLGRFDDRTDLRVAIEPVGRVEAFPDYAWLMALADSLSAGAGARRLPLTTNPYRQRIGERLDIAQSNVFGTSASNHVDLRLTAPVQQALSAAEEGASTDELAARLRAAHPDVAPATIDELIDSLLAQGVVYPRVVPSMAPGAEAAPILHALARGGAEFVPERDDLARIVDALASVRTTDDLDAVLSNTSRRQTALLPEFSGSTVTVNSTVALASATLSRAVARRVEGIAEVLTRTSFFPPRPASIVEYEHHFLERYGVDGEVPILELLSAGRGLEAPSGYQLPMRSYPFPGQAAPDDARGATVLLAAYTQALLAGTALELSDEILEAYATTDTRPPSATFDLFVRVLAPSAAAVDAGEFELALLPDGLALGGRATGRFTGVLDGASELVDAMLDRESAHSSPRTRHVVLRYLPDKARMANVARTAASARETLAVGVASDDAGGMDLSDVLVGNDGTSFYLRDRRNGELLRFVENHMLSPLSAPNVIRMLADLSTDGLRGFNIFDWGPLSHAPFLPRVVRGGVIYSPARWNVPPGRLSHGGGAEEFARLLGEVRASIRMPDRVTLVRDDNRLPLDLATEVDVAILAEEQSRAVANGTTLVFEESLDASSDRSDGSGTGVVADVGGAPYAHELVVSVALPAPAPAPDGTSATTVPARRTVPRDVRTSQEWDPRWVCVDVQAGLADLDLVVASHVSTLLEQTRTLRDRWFFVRYPLPGHALRIRLHARSPRHVDRLRNAVARWTDGLVAHRLITESSLPGYVPEFQRYGGEDLYRQALPVFEATSELALALASARAAAPLSSAVEDVIGVGLLAHLHGAIGVSHTDLRVVPSNDPAFRRSYRENRPALTAALDEPVGAWSGVGLAETPELTRSLRESREAMQRYARAFRRTHTEAELHGAAAAVVHMTFNRVYPIGNAVETRALGLWALAAEAAARREQAFSDLEPVGAGPGAGS